MLREANERYRQPLIVAETGTEGANGPGWLRYAGGEVRAALRAGVPVQGTCLYPVMDYPGWDDERHCLCGLIRADTDFRALNPAPARSRKSRRCCLIETPRWIAAAEQCHSGFTRHFLVASA